MDDIRLSLLISIYFSVQYGILNVNGELVALMLQYNSRHATSMAIFFLSFTNVKIVFLVFIKLYIYQQFSIRIFTSAFQHSICYTMKCKIKVKVHVIDRRLRSNSIPSDFNCLNTLRSFLNVPSYPYKITQCS